MATPGIIQASHISGSLDAKNIVMGVLKKQIELSNLSELCAQTQVPELTATIPLQTIMEGFTDLNEWEETEVKGSEFSNIDFLLKKDRVKIAVSDESRFRSKAGDPLGLQKDAAGTRLASYLDAKVVTALQTSPQTAGTLAIWSTATNNPLKDLARAVAACKPYKADFIIMPNDVWVQFAGNDYIKNLMTGNPGNLGNALAFIPGLNLKIYVNDNVTAKSCIVGASGCPAAVLGNGPVKVRQWDSPKGGEIYQIDVFRQVKAPIIANASSLNQGVYQTTGVIA